MNLVSPISLRRGSSFIWNSAQFTKNTRSGRVISTDPMLHQSLSGAITKRVRKNGLFVLTTSINHDPRTKELQARIIYCPKFRESVDRIKRKPYWFFNYGIFRTRKRFMGVESHGKSFRRRGPILTDLQVFRRAILRKKRIRRTYRNFRRARIGVLGSHFRNKFNRLVDNLFLQGKKYYIFRKQSLFRRMWWLRDQRTSPKYSPSQTTRNLKWYNNLSRTNDRELPFQEHWALHHKKFKTFFGDIRPTKKFRQQKRSKSRQLRIQAFTKRMVARYKTDSKKKLPRAFWGRLIKSARSLQRYRRLFWQRFGIVLKFQEAKKQSSRFITQVPFFHTYDKYIPWFRKWIKIRRGKWIRLPPKFWPDRWLEHTLPLPVSKYELSHKISSSVGRPVKVQMINIFRYLTTKGKTTYHDHQNHLWTGWFRKLRKKYPMYFDLMTALFLVCVFKRQAYVMVEHFLDLIGKYAKNVKKIRPFFNFLGKIIRDYVLIRRQFRLFKLILRGKVAGGTKRTKFYKIGYGELPIQTISKNATMNFGRFPHVFGEFGIKLYLIRREALSKGIKHEMLIHETKK